MRRHQLRALGTVEKVMDSIAIVKAHTGGEYRILDEGTFVLTDARQIVGTVRTSTGTFLISRYPKPLVR